jgi:hypothetical protein
MKWEIAQFFEIRWWQHYLGQQEVEDYLSRKKNYWEGILSACPFALSPPIEFWTPVAGRQASSPSYRITR